MLERDLHDFRQRVEPGQAVVDHEDRGAARLQHAMAFANQRRRIGGVLNHAVRINRVEAGVGIRQCLAVCNAKLFGRDPVQLEILARQIDVILRFEESLS